MPFREVSRMDDEIGVCDVWRRRREPIFGSCAVASAISPTTGYKWLERWQLGGTAGLAELSRRPHSSPCAQRCGDGAGGAFGACASIRPGAAARSPGG